MHRMSLAPEAFTPHGGGARAELLDERHEDEIRALFEDGRATGEEPDFFMRSQLQDGTFYGVRHEGRLVAAGGTHLYSRDESVGAIGNVYTHRAHRGRGLRLGGDLRRGARADRSRHPHHRAEREEREPGRDSRLRAAGLPVPCALLRRAGREAPDKIDRWLAGDSTTPTRGSPRCSTPECRRRRCASRGSWCSTGRWPRRWASTPTRWTAPQGAAIFAGNALPDEAQPLAQAYAGHQFGHFTALGDGRAILLGEQVTPGGDRFDIQLKGAGPTPLLAPRRRTGRARADAARVHRQRGDARAGHSHVAEPGGGDDGRGRVPRAGAAGRRADAGGRQSSARRHVRVGGRAQGPCGDGRARRLHAAPSLSAGRGGAASSPRALRRHRRAAGGAAGAVAAGRLHPRRDEHRQHVAGRRDHRLRSVRVHGRLRSAHRLQLHRPGRALRLWQSAGDRAVEPRPAGRSDAAALRRRSGARGGAGECGDRALRGARSSATGWPACAPSSDSSPRIRTTRT